MLKKFINRVVRGQKGFTLIEMIVVVGIIAVLAAVIVPNIGRFIGSGEEGAKKAEAEAVQTAMNAMMADLAITSVTPSAAGSPADNRWTNRPVTTEALPSGKVAADVGLDNYLQSPNTTYFYCYDGQGQISDQFEDATGACP